MSSLEKAAENLNKHGFQAQVVNSAEKAKAVALDLIGPAQSVGFGGSITVRDLGLYETLQERGVAVHWHWKTPEQAAAAHAAANRSDVFLCSANAVLESGALLNIDGTGNRVASMFFGPKKVVVIAGKNKLVEGGYEEALARVKECACPPNARRLSLKTPCAATGKCTDCSSPQRMCKVTVLMERPSNALKDVHVLLVDEELGY